MAALADTAGVEIPLDGSVAFTVLPVGLVTQIPYQNLCWAACCAMVLNADNPPTPPWTAASLAKYKFNVTTDYPVDPGLALRDCGIPFADSMTTSHVNGFDATTLVSLLDTGMPVMVFWVYRADPRYGHVALVIGYSPYDGGTFCVADPLYQSDYWLTWDQLQTYNTTMMTCDTFYDIGSALRLVRRP